MHATRTRRALFPGLPLVSDVGRAKQSPNAARDLATGRPCTCQPSSSLPFAPFSLPETLGTAAVTSVPKIRHDRRTTVSRKDETRAATLPSAVATPPLSQTDTLGSWRARSRLSRSFSLTGEDRTSFRRGPPSRLDPAARRCVSCCARGFIGAPQIKNKNKKKKKTPIIEPSEN